MLLGTGAIVHIALDLGQIDPEATPYVDLLCVHTLEIPAKESERMEIEVGQVLEFVDPVEVEGRTIMPGTHARVGNVLTAAAEPTVTLVFLGQGRGGKVLLNHDIASSHCRIV